MIRKENLIQKSPPKKRLQRGKMKIVNMPAAVILVQKGDSLGKLQNRNCRNRNRNRKQRKKIIYTLIGNRTKNARLPDT